MAHGFLWQRVRVCARERERELLGGSSWPIETPQKGGEGQMCHCVRSDRERENEEFLKDRNTAVE